MICTCSHTADEHTQTPFGPGACALVNCPCWRFDLDMSQELAK